MQNNQTNYTTKRYPRTLNEAFPNTVSTSVCIYKPCFYDITMRKVLSFEFIVWLCVVFLSILAFIGLVVY